MFLTLLLTKLSRRFTPLRFSRLFKSKNSAKKLWGKRTRLEAGAARSALCWRSEPVLAAALPFLSNCFIQLLNVLLKNNTETFQVTFLGRYKPPKQAWKTWNLVTLIAYRLTCSLERPIFVWNKRVWGCCMWVCRRLYDTVCWVWHFVFHCVLSMRFGFRGTWVTQQDL